MELIDPLIHFGLELITVALMAFIGVIFYRRFKQLPSLLNGLWAAAYSLPVLGIFLHGVIYLDLSSFRELLGQIPISVTTTWPRTFLIITLIYAGLHEIFYGIKMSTVRNVVKHVLICLFISGAAIVVFQNTDLSASISIASGFILLIFIYSVNLMNKIQVPKFFIVFLLIDAIGYAHGYFLAELWNIHYHIFHLWLLLSAAIWAIVLYRDTNTSYLSSLRKRMDELSSKKQGKLNELESLLKSIKKVGA